MCSLDEAFNIPDLNSSCGNIYEINPNLDLSPIEDNYLIPITDEMIEERDRLHRVCWESDSKYNDFPRPPIDYQPFFNITNGNGDFTKKPDNFNQMAEEISKNLDSQPVCEYSRAILKKYKILDTRRKALEYYYDNSADIFYFSYLDKEPYVHILAWKDYRKQSLVDIQPLVENELTPIALVNDIRGKLVDFPDEKRRNLVFEKLQEFLKNTTTN